MRRASRSRPASRQMFRKEFVARSGIALLDGYGSTETNFVIGAHPSVQRSGMMGAVVEGFEARVVDEEDNELPDGEAGELTLRAAEPFAFASGYFGMPEKTVEAWRNLWFHTGDRVMREQRRLVSLPRPYEGRDPPARREHLVLRGRAGADQPSGGRLGRGLPGAFRACRGRGDGRDRAQARQADYRSSSSCDILRAAPAALSRCRASSSSSTSCRRPKTARCRNSSCANAAFSPEPGTARSRGGRRHENDIRVAAFAQLSLASDQVTQMGFGVIAMSDAVVDRVGLPGRALGPTEAQSRKAIYAATIGNVMEWYDFGVFGFLAGIAGAEFLPEGRPATSAAQHLPDLRRRPHVPSARRHRHRPHGRHAGPQARAGPDHPADGGRHRDHRAAADLCLDRRHGPDPAAGRPAAAGLLHRRRMGRRHRLHGRVVGRGEARLLHQLPADVGGRRQPAGRRASPRC